MSEPARIAAVVDDLQAAQRFLREAAEATDISRETLDELAGLPKGYTAKLLCEPPLKNLGPTSFFPLAGALGFALAFVVDEPRRARIVRITKRKPGGPRGTKWRNARALAVIRKFGSDGARKRRGNMTAEQFSTHQSKAATSRWRKWRKAQRVMRKRPELMKQISLSAGALPRRSTERPDTPPRSQSSRPRP